MSIGFTLPFARSTGSLGFFEATDDELAAVKQNIKSLILTNWGERPMHYNFGCNLIEFIFSNGDGEELRERIHDRIVDQISKWMPYISIDEVGVFFPDDDLNLGIPDHGIGVTVRYRLSNRPELTQFINLPVIPG